jgi:hypothetical protein
MPKTIELPDRTIVCAVMTSGLYEIELTVGIDFHQKTRLLIVCEPH